MSERTNQLEHAVLELGTELYRLKSSIGKLTAFQDEFFGIMKGLKHILDEKGLITLDDFEAAIDLGAVAESVKAKLDAAASDGDGQFKKSTH